MNGSIRCENCGSSYPHGSFPFMCSCGGVFDFCEFTPFTRDRVDGKRSGLMKYADIIGLSQDSSGLSLGEGNTPLLKTAFNKRSIYLKMESQNPTSSYKDRGFMVLVSHLVENQVMQAVEDSSGNAGASFAAYAARSGLKARIYVPESTSGPKANQITMYGAELVRIPGPRAEAARAVLEEASKGVVYASHAYMPFGLAGIATIAYEIIEQLGEVPGTLISPVGHGGLLYGIMLGFSAMLKAGEINKLPYYIGVQPANCAPIFMAFQSGDLSPVPIEAVPTIAEGSSVTKPVRGAAILEKMKNRSGSVVIANETEIISSYKKLAQLGFYCEPTAALSITPLLNDKIRLVDPVVSIITGGGLKSNILL